jgi:general secretion pathway protein A
VNSRMARAGLKNQNIMTPRLLDEIHFRSQGIPRLINATCDNLLLTAFAMESRTATLEMLDEVTADMRLEYPGRSPFRPDSNYPEQVLRRPEVRFRAE